MEIAFPNYVNIEWSYSECLGSSLTTDDESYILGMRLDICTLKL